MFEERMREAQQLVESALVSVLAEQSSVVPERLAASLRHGVLGGGKRFRPFLVIETARLFGVAPERAVATAAALECIHCYSLVHDDLPAMDNDRLRRGQPTVWAAFDEWTAILAGDALLTLAFEILARETTDPDPKVRLTLVGALAAASGRIGMVGGQAVDLEADKLGRPALPDLAHVRRLQSMKTGALITFACEAGAILGHASASERRALHTFGDHLGFAFQISDDLLDATGTVEAVGKAVAKDATAGKATLVSLMGLEEARRKLAEVEGEAIAALAPFGERAAVLVDAVRFMGRRQN